MKENLFKHQKIRLSQKNEHLLNVFSKGYFLQLGSINYKDLNNLLHGKKVAFFKLGYEEHVLTGIGSSKLTREEYKRISSLIYFEKMLVNDKTLQAFITYGSVSVCENNRETFAPVVLIPVKFNFKEDQYIFQKDGEPIVNEVLIKKLNDKKLNFNKKFNFRTLFSIDEFCYSFSAEYNLKLESFLTVAKLKSEDLSIDYNKFIINNRLVSKYKNRVAIKDDLLFQVFSLNDRQRYALEKICEGHSFALIGNKGTGKTRTLLSAAFAQVMKNKKVLYITNDYQTMREVKNLISEYDFDHILEKSKNFHAQKEVTQTSTFNFSKLTKLYDELEKYEESFSKRYLNVRLIDALENLIISEDKIKNFDIDKLNELSKFEFSQVLQALKKIEKTKISKLPIKNSKFININFSSKVASTSEVKKLLVELKEDILSLRQIQNKLTDDYEFKQIEDIASFKKIAYAYGSLVKVEIPKFWFDEPSVILESGVKEQEKLLSEIIKLENEKKQVISEYDVSFFVEPSVLINKIFGPFFTYKDEEKIDLILKDLSQISSRLNIVDDTIKNFINSSKLIENEFQITIDDSTIEMVVNRLTLFLDTYGKFRTDEVSLKEMMQNDIKSSFYREKLELLENNLNLIQNKKTRFYDLFGFEATSENILKVRSEEVLPQISITDETLDKFLLKLEEFLSKEKELNEDYKKITLAPFISSKSNLDEFDRLNEFIRNQEKSPFEQKLVNKIIRSTPDPNMNDYKVFVYAFNLLKNYHSGFKKYLDFDEVLLFERLKKLITFNNYIKDLVEVKGMFLKILKRPAPNLSFSDFLTYQKTIAKVRKFEEEFSSNLNYHKFFGSLFTGINTDTNKILVLLNEYETFINSYKNEEEAINCLRNNDIVLAKDLENADKLINNVYARFKKYNYIFDDSILKFYYDSSAKLLSWLDDLLDSEDELKDYLKIKDSIKLLKDLKLKKLVSLVIGGFDSDLIKYIEKLYYQNIVDLAKTSSQAFKVKADLFKLSSDLIDEENTFFNTNINELKSIFLQSKFKNGSLKLCDIKYFNKHLKPEKYDLILVDDAHLFASSYYLRTFKAKQLIIAGENKAIYGENANIISGLRDENVVRLIHRFNTTPLGLSSFSHNLICGFPKTFKENEGVLLRSERVENIIIGLLMKSDDEVINYFTPQITSAKYIYEKLIEAFADDFTREDIYKMILERINITSLDKGYSFNADFNIINIDDYKSVKEQMVIDYLKTLVVCRKKLIIIDENDELSKNASSLFIREINKLISKSHPFFSEITNKVIEKIAPLFEKHNYHIEGKYYDLSLVVSKDSKYFGLVLFFDSSLSRFNVLNDIKKYKYGCEKNICVSFLLLTDLYQNYEKAVLNTIKEWEDASKTRK